MRLTKQCLPYIVGEVPRRGGGVTAPASTPPPATPPALRATSPALQGRL
jgi:hypothetical protein